MAVLPQGGMIVFPGPVLLAGNAGRVSMRIGEAGYSGGRTAIPVTNHGDAAEGQVGGTICRSQDLHQQEPAVSGSPVSLKTGEHILYFPAGLPPGRYTRSVHLIRNGERKTAQVRDIGV